MTGSGLAVSGFARHGGSMTMDQATQPPHDVVVIGSGAAGLTAALALAQSARVLVLAKGSLTGGSTAWNIRQICLNKQKDVTR